MKKAVFVSLSLCFLVGCAPKSPKTHSLYLVQQPEKDPLTEDKDPRDPFESFNRKSFAFNRFLNRTIFLPFIGFYRLMPPVIKNRVISLVDTVESPISIVNCLLQGKIHDCLAHTARLIFNAVFGLGGLFDVATAMKIRPPKQNFSKTLGKIGVPAGPYLVVPLLGPSTLRASIGEFVDCAVMPVTYFEPTAIAYYTTSYITNQAKIVELMQDVKDTFSDPYSAVRDVYFIARGDAQPVNQDSSISDDSNSDSDSDLLGEDVPNGDENQEPNLLDEDDPLENSPTRTMNQESESPPDLLGE